MGGPAPDSVNPANKAAEEKVTVVNLDAWLYKLTRIVAKQQEDLVAKDATIKDLTERLSKLETSNVSGVGTTSSRPLFSSHFNEKTTEAEVQILAKVHREMKASKSIETHIIVSGLPEPGGGTEAEKDAHDQASVEELLGKLSTQLVNLKSHKRIKTKNNEKPSLMLIEFHEACCVPVALSNSKKLRTNTKFKGVYINKDMTKTERIIGKQLRDERKRLNAMLTEKGDGEWPRGRHQGKLFHWGIRDGELRRIFDKPTQTT